LRQRLPIKLSLICPIALTVKRLQILDYRKCKQAVEEKKMLPVIHADQNLETAVLKLLERYSLEDIIETLYNYTNMQASLAKVLNQKGAVTKWERQSEALQTACEMLDEVYNEEYYLIY
jgi:hypothetical protein